MQPLASVRVGRPQLDPIAIPTGREGVVAGEALELSVEVEAAAPPLVKGDVAVSDGEEPLSGLALDGQC